MINADNLDYCMERSPDKIVVLCAVDKDFNKEEAFKFLTETRDKLLELYDLKTLKSTKKNSLDGFKETLEQLVQLYNTRWLDKSKLALRRVEETKEVVILNLKNVLERDQNILDMNVTSDLITDNSVVLMNNSNKLRRTT